MQTPEKHPQPRLQLTDARSQRGLSQQEVADLIGTTYVNVSRWERGITKPSPYFRRKLCALFGRTEQELDLLPPGPSNGSLTGAQGGSKTREGAAGAVATVNPPTPPSDPAPLYDSAIPLLPAVKLIGRENDLGRIKQRLIKGGNVALTALNGLPGVGKTALSITLAHDAEMRAHFRDGVLWAGLGPQPNMAGILSRWGALLGLSARQVASLNDYEAWAKALRMAIGNRYMLLVIDDAWELEDALVLRVGGNNCAHLVTTRFPYIASSVTVDGATLIQELNEDDSVQLLGQLAPQVVTREAQRVHRLVQAVGGLPLALTLMGNYLRKQAHGPSRRISAALERLSDAETRLQISEPHVPVESHPSLPVEISLSLQTVISVTDQLLTSQARTTLYALAVFPPKPNTFSEEAALVVAGCSLDELDSLIDAGLLESNGLDRYLLHQVIADYARVQLQQEPEAEAEAYQRLIAYVVDYVEEHKKSYEQLEVESNVILYSLEAAFERECWPELIKIVSAFAPYMLARGQYSTAEKHLQRAYKVALKQDDKDDIPILLLYIGEVAQKQGNFALAESHYQEGLAVAREGQNEEQICALLTNLAWITWRTGRYEQAEVYSHEGLQLARSIDDTRRISDFLRVLGSIVGSQGNYTQAETYLQEGLTLARQLGDPEQICTLLINLGATAGGQGKHDQAEVYFSEGLVLARQIGHREQISVLLINLGEAASKLEHYDQAEKYFKEALDLARQLEHREWISALLNNLGFTARKQRAYLEAEKFLQEGLTLARQIGRPQITANILYEYGNLCFDKADIKNAEAIFREVLTLIPEKDKELSGLAYYGLARTLSLLGEKEEAQRFGEISLTMLKEIDHWNVNEVKNWITTIRN